MSCLNGVVSHLSRFLPNLSDVMEPLPVLTHEDVEWCWSGAWSEAKSLIASAPVLFYYKPNEPLEEQCESSQAGLGAAVMQGGHPIAYASRAFLKEMLAIVFTMEKFNDYTYGRKTVVFSDHKPLESILKKLPLHRAPNEKENTMFLADTPSRAFLPACEQDESEFETINMIKCLPVSEERLLQIQRGTEADEFLQVLKAVIQKGWPVRKSNLPSIISPYFNMPDEISIQDGPIFKGERVAVPRASRSELLRRIHISGSLKKRRYSKTKNVSAGQARISERNCAKSTG